MPIVFFHEPQSKLAIGLPIPDITPMNPPLGLVPPLPPKLVKLSDTGHLSPGLGAMMKGLAYVAQHSDSVFGKGTLDVARLRPSAEIPLAASACAVRGCPTTACTT